jgi:hypothetical protein
MVIGQEEEGKTYVNHPPKPNTETCNPEFPTLLYCIPVFLGSGQAILRSFLFCVQFVDLRKNFSVQLTFLSMAF